MDFDLQKILSGLMLVGGAIAWYADYRRRLREEKKAERDALRADYDRIYAERNSYRDRCEQLEKDKDTLERERDALRDAVAKIQHSLDAALELKRKVEEMHESTS